VFAVLKASTLSCGNDSTITKKIMNNTVKVILGVLAGLAVGTMLGVLFAPNKGTDTRKKITKKGEDYVDTIKEKFSEFLDGITDRFEKAKEEGEEMVSNGKAKLEHAEREAKSVRA
jgi:gas vesicle protein